MRGGRGIKTCNRQKIMISRRLVNILSDNSRKKNLGSGEKKRAKGQEKQNTVQPTTSEKREKCTFIYTSGGYDAVHTSLARR